MKKVTFILMMFLSLNSCRGQEKKDYLKISDLKFESIFGTNSKEPSNTYCLLGTGFFRTPSSGNSDSLITQWLEIHKNAIVVPISSMPSSTYNPNARLIYCWVIENNDTLNNFLIKNGCFPGGTMMRPPTFEELEDWEKEFSDEPYDVKVYINKETYDTFIEQIIAAEIYAEENKLGIWKTKLDK